MESKSRKKKWFFSVLAPGSGNWDGALEYRRRISRNSLGVKIGIESELK